MIILRATFWVALVIGFVLAIGFSNCARAAYTYDAAGAYAVTTASATFNVAYPAGTTDAGDLLVLCAACRGAGCDIDTPSGWTALEGEDGTRTALFGKVAAGSESGNLSVSIAGGEIIGGGQIARFNTAATGWALAEHAGANDSFFTQVDMVIPALTISEANTLVLACAGRNYDISPVTAPPTNFTTIGYGGDGNTGSFYGGAFGYWIQTTATSVGSGTKFDSADTDATGNTLSAVSALSMPTPDAVGGMTPLTGPFRGPFGGAL